MVDTWLTFKFALVFHDCIQMSHQGQQNRQDVKIHKTTLFSKCFSNLMPSSVKQIHLLLHLYHFPKRQSLPFIQTGNDDTQCIALWLKFSVDYILKHFSYFFFPRKQVLTFHANCLQWRQFAWNVKSCFLGKIRNVSSICHLLNYPR